MAAWYLWAVGAVAVTIVVMWAVGFAMPRNHSVTASAWFAASGADVFATLATPAGYATWRSRDVVSAISEECYSDKPVGASGKGEVLARLQPADGVQVPAWWEEQHGRMVVRYTVRHAEVNDDHWRMTVELASTNQAGGAGVELPFGGSWEFVVEQVTTPQAGKRASGKNRKRTKQTDNLPRCKVEVREVGYVNGPILRFLQGVVMGYSSTCDQHLADLAAVFAEVSDDEDVPSQGSGTKSKRE